MQTLRTIMQILCLFTNRYISGLSEENCEDKKKSENQIALHKAAYDASMLIHFYFIYLF